jgi:hypothetical protein
MKEVRFIVYQDYEKSKLQAELEEKFPDIKLEISEESEDTVEIKTDKPNEVYLVLTEKTLTYVER